VAIFGGFGFCVMWLFFFFGVRSREQFIPTS
jgi:hypothetical protein